MRIPSSSGVRRKTRANVSRTAWVIIHRGEREVRRSVHETDVLLAQHAAEQDEIQLLVRTRRTAARAA